MNYFKVPHYATFSVSLVIPLSLSLRSRCFSSYFVLKHGQSIYDHPFSVKDQVSHPFKRKVKITVLYILMFMVNNL